MLLIGWLGSGAVLGETAEERISAYLTGFESMRANFEQTLYDEDLNRLEDSSGTMYLQRPGRFRWDYSQPYPQVIISNGETLWVYDSELEQVTVRDLGDEIENTPTMLLSSEQPLGEHFDITELSD